MVTESHIPLKIRTAGPGCPAPSNDDLHSGSDNAMMHSGSNNRQQWHHQVAFEAQAAVAGCKQNNSRCDERQATQLAVRSSAAIERYNGDEPNTPT